MIIALMIAALGAESEPCVSSGSYAATEAVAAIDNCQQTYLYADLILSDGREVRLPRPRLDAGNLCGLVGRHADVACFSIDEVEVIYLAHEDAQ